MPKSFRTEIPELYKNYISSRISYPTSTINLSDAFTKPPKALQQLKNAILNHFNQLHL